MDNKKIYDARLEALCYTLNQVFTNHNQLMSVLGNSDEEWLEQLKKLADEIDFRDEELLACCPREEYVQMHDNAKKTFYDPDLVHIIKEASSTMDLKLLTDIYDCRKALWRCAEDPGHTVTISVHGKSYHFYDHAAFIQGLSDALDYFESEL